MHNDKIKMRLPRRTASTNLASCARAAEGLTTMITSKWKMYSFLSI